MYFDDWVKHTDIRNFEDEKVLWSNEAGQIWSMSYCKEIIHAILNNQDIEKVIGDKNKKLHDRYMQQETEQQQQQLVESTKRLDNINKHILEINKIKTILGDFKQDIENILKKHSKIIDKSSFMSVLFSYFYEGVFEKGFAYNKLTQPSLSLVDMLIKGIPFKRLKKDIDDFLQKYERLHIKNIIDNLSISKDFLYENIINNIFKAIISLDWEMYDIWIKELEKNENTLIEQQNVSNQEIKNIKNQILKQEKSFQDSKVIQQEDKIIRDFAQEIRQEIQNPKKLDISNYVVGLNDVPDDEIVMFNIGLTNGKKDGDKIENILEYNNLEFGNQINQWYIRCEKIDNSDKGKFELFSPLMTAREAKSVMPKLIADFDRAHVSSGLVIPIKAQQLFANLNKNHDKTEIKQDNLKQLIFGAILRQNLQSHKVMIKNPQKEIHELGFNNQEELPQAFYSLEEIKEKFPKDKFLFSGSTASDDYLLLSGRSGRTGTVYATPDIKYASVYDGVTNIGSKEGTTATGDRYVSSIISNIFDKDVQVGFINVYAQSSNDMYFSNFGMEDYRRFIDSKEQPKIFDMCEPGQDGRLQDAHKKGQTSPNKILTRDQAINGFVGRYAGTEINGKFYMPFAFDSETFVTPEKNPLIEKFMHIKYGRVELFIPVNENKTNKVIQDILNNRIADIKRTFQYSLREDILDRLEKQEKQYKKITFEKGRKKVVKDENTYVNSFDYDR